MEKNLFKDFEKVSAKKWEQKIISDLKGKPIDSLNWELNDNITLHPHYTVEDTKNIDFPILRTNNPEWQIGEKIEVKNYKEANKRALDILMKGVNAPVFHFFSMPTENDFNHLFENIGIEFIATHFSFETDGFDYQKFYGLWVKLLKKRDLESTFACFDFDALLLKEEENLNAMVEIVANNEDYAQETIHINAKRFYTNEANTAKELKNTIAKAKEYFDFFMSKGIPAKKIAQQTFFTVNIGLSYLVQVAKIRALKLLWVELLKSYQVEETLPFIKVEFAPNAYGENKDDNLINETSLCMSAVLGGANHIIVTPTEETEKGKRLARNVQLILKHESGFNQVADPMAGSYYIEVLTSIFLEKAKN